MVLLVEQSALSMALTKLATAKNDIIWSMTNLDPNSGLETIEAEGREERDLKNNIWVNKKHEDS